MPTSLLPQDAPHTEPHLDDLGEAEGPRLGKTERTKAGYELVRCLHKTCRSFVLYDARNEAIVKFLAELRDRVDSSLVRLGDLNFEVRPWEMVLDGEVVYIERDRERSLAFRLYRDGIRRLVFKAGLGWDETLRLLEVLSLRTIGAGATEDDTVTLIAKAALTHVEIEAIEGFVPHEENPEDTPTAGGGSVADSHVEAPLDFDLPLPAYETPAMVQHRPVPDRLLAGLRDEEGPGTLPELAVRLLEELAEVIADPTDPMELADVLPFAREVRDYLLIAEDLVHLGALAKALLRLPGEKPGESALHAVFREPDVFGRTVMTMLRRGGEPTLERTVLAAFPGQVLEHVLVALNEDPEGAQLELLRDLLRRYAAANPRLLLDRVSRGDALAVRELVPVIQEFVRDQSYPTALMLLSHPELDAQRAGLALLHGHPLSPVVGPKLIPLLSSPSSELRHDATALLGRLRDHETWNTLVGLAQGRGARPFDQAEAEAIGTVLYRMSPDAAPPMFQEWLKPQGLFQRLTRSSAPTLAQAVAIWGLAAWPGEPGELALRAVMPKVDDELKRLIASALARRRNREPRHG